MTQPRLADTDLATRDAATSHRGAPAFRCQICQAMPLWRVLRRGDLAVSWACLAHLTEVCSDLQRAGETTELIVTISRFHNQEWSTVATNPPASHDETPPARSLVELHKTLARTRTAQVRAFLYRRAITLGLAGWLSQRWNSDGTLTRKS